MLLLYVKEFTTEHKTVIAVIVYDILLSEKLDPYLCDDSVLV